MRNCNAKTVPRNQGVGGESKTASAQPTIGYKKTKNQKKMISQTTAGSETDVEGINCPCAVNGMWKGSSTPAPSISVIVLASRVTKLEAPRFPSMPIKITTPSSSSASAPDERKNGSPT